MLSLSTFVSYTLQRYAFCLELARNLIYNFIFAAQPHIFIWAQRIKSVEVCNLGSSVVAGLVPATNPWYGIFPTHQRDWRKRSIGSHADNADFIDGILCAVSEICVS